MENDGPLISANTAANRLQGYADTRALVDHRGPSRSLSRLLLWEAVAMAAFLGAFLLSFGGRTSDDAFTGAATHPLWLLVFPVVVLHSLVDGARERFSIRGKPTPPFWVAYVVIFTASSYLVIGRIDYPWWVNLLAPALLFATMAARPIRQLRSSGALDTQRWPNESLSRSARWTTVQIGFAMGLLTVTSTQPWFSTVAAVLMLLFFVVALFSPRVPRTGFEWGTIHWGAFGVVMSLLFLLTVLLSTTDWVTALICVIAGAIALLVMLVAAFLPLPASKG